MAWFDGTIDEEYKDLIEKFPVAVTDNLRTNKKHNKIAIINDYPEGSNLSELSDPHLEYGVYFSHIFYHVFFGDDAIKAEEFIDKFTAKGHGKGEYEVELYRIEGGRLFMYSFGELHTECAFSKFMIYDEIKNQPNYYALPLKAYAFECPICKAKVLKYRGMFEICEFCGWEDDNEDEEDDPDELDHGPNGGGFTMKEYRDDYKNQLFVKYGKPFEELTERQKMLWTSN